MEFPFDSVRLELGEFGVGASVVAAPLELGRTTQLESPRLRHFHGPKLSNDTRQFIGGEPPDLIIMDRFRLVVVRVRAVESEPGQRLPRNTRIGIPEWSTDSPGCLAEQFEVMLDRRPI